AEGETPAGVEHRPPGVRPFDALGPEAALGPRHVARRMGRLHRGDDAVACDAGELLWRCDLEVLDAEAILWRHARRLVLVDRQIDAGFVTSRPVLVGSSLYGASRAAPREPSAPSA